MDVAVEIHTAVTIAVAIKIVLLNFLGRQRKWLSETLNVEHLSETGRAVARARLRRIDSDDQLGTRLTRDTRIGLGKPQLCLTEVSMRAWIFFGTASSAVTFGLSRLQLRGNVSGGWRPHSPVPAFHHGGRMTRGSSRSWELRSRMPAPSLPIGAVQCRPGVMASACTSVASVALSRPLRCAIPRPRDLGTSRDLLRFPRCGMVGVGPICPPQVTMNGVGRYRRGASRAPSGINASTDAGTNGRARYSIRSLEPCRKLAWRAGCSAASRSFSIA